jgi:tRNA(adenine34) deaminase
MSDPFAPAPSYDTDERFMRAALAEAEAALENDDVPVGSVIVHSGRIIGRGFNQRELLQDPTAHAEMLAMTAAAEHVKSWRLLDCTLYVTLEPCAMCAGAIVLARIPRLVFGATDPKTGACGSVFNIVSDDRLNHSVNALSGILEHDCAALLKAFFSQQRAMGKK